VPTDDDVLYAQDLESVPNRCGRAVGHATEEIAFLERAIADAAAAPALLEERP